MITEALEFLYRNARLLERRLARLTFEEASPADAVAVLETLRGYQNPDGGLGNALEPDVRAPESQPLAVDFALDAVERLLTTPAGKDIREEARAFGENLLPYLGSVAKENGGLPLVLESIRKYPSAAHWQQGFGFTEGLNPTANIAARLRMVGVSASWLDAADAFCRDRIDALDPAALDGHTAGNVLRYLENAAATLTAN